MLNIKNKTVVVTGAAQGIGAAFAKYFAAQGAKIIIADISDTTSVVNEIISSNGQAFGIKTDVTSDESLENMVAQTEKKFGPIEILINNAAIFTNMDLKPFTDIQESEWEAMMRVNVRGVWQCTKAIKPSMVRNGRGKIINISSATVFKGPPGQMHYVASKGAVLAMSRSMARELAEFNICVNCISPSLTLSEGVLNNPAFKPFRESTLSARVLQREMTPEDLLGTAHYLASPASDFITGQNINVDGGTQMT